MALETTHSAISEAISLACEASEMQGTPAMRSRAVWCTIRRAALRRMSISSSLQIAHNPHEHWIPA